MTGVQTCALPISLRFSNDHFTMIGLKVDGKPLLRAYSIVSPNYEEHLEFLSIKVPDGPLTSRLQHIQPGDTIIVGRKPTGTLLIDYLLPGKRLYLMSTGTGLAPFMSIIRDPETYERFEQVVALVLSAVIAVIIVVSLFQLISIVFTLLVLDAFNPLDHKVFQSVFGMIMTLLIAMEFKHSIVRVALRRDSIIQVKTVILIGLIALARKFVVLDPEASPGKIAALAGATLALGATYWLLRERDDRAAETSEHAPSSSQ